MCFRKHTGYVSLLEPTIINQYEQETLPLFGHSPSPSVSRGVILPFANNCFSFPAFIYFYIFQGNVLVWSAETAIYVMGNQALFFVLIVIAMIMICNQLFLHSSLFQFSLPFKQYHMSNCAVVLNMAIKISEDRNSHFNTLR